MIKSYPNNAFLVLLKYPKNENVRIAHETFLVHPDFCPKNEKLRVKDYDTKYLNDEKTTYIVRGGFAIPCNPSKVVMEYK